MAISGGPDIVEDGLVLHLDAADRNSYAGLGPELVSHSNLIIPDDGNYQRIERTASIHRSISPVSSTVEYGKTYQVSWKVLNLRVSNTGAGLRRGGTYVTGSPNLALSPGFYTSTLYNSISTGELSLYGDSTAGVDFDLDYLSIRELPTTINNLTGNGNNGTFAAGTACPTFNGNNGGSFVFDGSNDNIESVSFTPNITNKTLSGWVKLGSVTQQGGGLINLQSNSGTTFDAIVYNETNQGWGFGSNGFVRTGWSGVKETSTTEWVNIAATYENLNYNLYRNGVLIFTLNSFNVLNYNFLSKSLVGYRHTGATSNGLLNANISQVSIYNRALTNSEILQNFEATKGRFGL